jgi:GNAT superfamily N-acetyltransferase
VTFQANFILRSYEDDDAACASIFKQAWHAGHPYAPRRIGLDEFRYETANRSMIVAQAEDGRVLGFAAVYMPDAFVHHLYVDPTQTGQGVGRALLAAAVALAGGRATLKCQARNTRALQFYRREGWTEAECGETDGEPWIRMLSPIPTLMRAALATSAKRRLPLRRQ